MDLYSVFFGNTPELLVYNCIGYAGSLFVIISMMMTQMIKLRFFNSTGCVFSIIFCVLTLNMPVLILNASLLIINVFQIIRYFSTKRIYEIIDIEVTGHTLRHFINKYRQRIMAENPSFFNRYPDSNYAKVVFCDDAVVGMIVGRRDGDKVDFFMNYVDPNYRSKTLVNLLISAIKNDNIKVSIMTAVPEKHYKIYQKFGWIKEDDRLVFNY